MNKPFLVILVLLLLRCNGDRGTGFDIYALKEYNYAMVNILEEELTVRFFGTDDINNLKLDIMLPPADTSTVWGFEGLINMTGGGAFGERFSDSIEGANKRFPFHCDSIMFELERKVVKTYLRKATSENDKNWATSIFNLTPDGPYVYDSIKGVHYYPLDSVNLGLK